MHKLIEYVCKELEDLERKSENGKLSMAEIQYGDTLAHFKKNLLKGEEMMGEEYSMDDGYNRSYGMYPRMSGRSYSRRRDNMGRYSRNGYSMDDGMMDELRDLMNKAPDDRTRQEFQKFIQKMEQM